MAQGVKRPMETLSPLAGKAAPREILVDLSKLERAFSELVAEFGRPYYTRIDKPASPEQKAKLGALTPESVRASSLAGEPITARLTSAPGNGASIGGLKVVAESGWFAARPSGTENIYKIYAESFRDEAHLEKIVSEAQEIVHAALTSIRT